jgi:DNA polymerase III sliding clamp (beta) subunit (PCNA family)
MNSMTLVHSHAGPSALLERDDLVAALDIAIGASARKHTIPILNTVRMSYSTEFERCIVVTTTDLDCQVSINVRANVSDEFSAAVPVQTFRDILRKIPETERNRLALELLAAPPERRRVEDGDGNETWEEVRRNSFVSDRMQVRLGRATFELKSLPVDDFPEMPA